MADKATNGTEDLVQAYNKAVECAVSATDASVAQATIAVKLMSEAAETERKEFGKVMEQGTAQARKRSENLAAVLPGIWQGFAVKPGASAPEFGAEFQESVGKLIESETAFYESMAQVWVQYFTGTEQRRSAATKALMENNVKALESSQRAAKGAVEYGEALFNWSMETAKAQSKKS